MTKNLASSKDALDMKTLVLINPVDKRRTGFSQDQVSKFPPLALGVVAALTPSNWKVKIIDENFKEARFIKADLVGITSYTENVARAYEIAALFKENGVPVVMGGIHASMCPDEALMYCNSVVIGEAESLWPQAIKDFESGFLKDRYKTADYIDAAEIPHARHDLFHPLYWYRIIQTSRGCPHDCDFCTVTAFNGRRYRKRPVEEVLNEIESCKSNYKSFIFADDNLIGNTPSDRARALELFKGIVERNIKIEWFSQVTVDIADHPELLYWARKSGCRILLVGVEAETNDGLEKLNKKVNQRKGGKLYYRKAFRIINKHRIAVLGTFILGLETDSKQDIINRANFIVNSWVDAAQTSILTPFPGTRLHARLHGTEKINCTNFPNDWHYFRFMDLTYNHPELSHEELASTIERAWRIIYKRRVIISNAIRTFLVTKSFSATMWAYHSNVRYRRDVLEQPVRRLS